MTLIDCTTQTDDAGVNDLGYSARCVPYPIPRSSHACPRPNPNAPPTHPYIRIHPSKTRPESPLKGKTPVLDGLAAESVRLKEYYAHPVWCVEPQI